jgi:hypothetical protein
VQLYGHVADASFQAGQLNSSLRRDTVTTDKAADYSDPWRFARRSSRSDSNHVPGMRRMHANILRSLN